MTPAPLAESRFVKLLEWAALALLVLLTVLPKALQPSAFRTHAFDTGIYTNIVWNTAHGRVMHTDLLDLPARPGQSAPTLGGNHLGDHFSPVMILLAPLAWVTPAGHLATALCAVQGLAAGGALVLIYFLARDIMTDLGAHKSRIGAWCITLLTAFSQAFSHAVWFEFHPSTVGMLFLAGLLLALRNRASLWAVICAALLLTCKESAALGVLGAALYAGLALGRWRTAALLAAAAGTVAAVALGVVMPWARGGQTWPKYDRLDPLSDLAGKALYLGKLLISTAFLPFAAGRTVLIALPTIALNLSVGLSKQYDLMHHYDDLTSILLAVAAAHGLKDLALKWPSPAAPALRMWTLTAVTLVVATSVVRGRDGWSDLKRTRQERNAPVLRTALAPFTRLPPGQGIVTQAVLVPALCERQRIVLLKGPPDLATLHPGDLLLLTLQLDNPNGEITTLVAWAEAHPQLVPEPALPPLRAWRVRAP